MVGALEKNYGKAGVIDKPLTKELWLSASWNAPASDISSMYFTSVPVSDSKGFSGAYLPTLGFYFIGSDEYFQGKRAKEFGN